MTTWYVDYDGGTDANASVGNGDSFATRRKKTNNLPIGVLTPGDTIRVMASPAPTLLGNTTWTDGPLATNLSIASSTNATPIVITSAAAHALVTGDTVIITSHATNTRANGVWTITQLGPTTFSLDGSIGNGVGVYTGGYRKFTNAVVTLPAPCTLPIALHGNQLQTETWTPNTTYGCSATKLTNAHREGGECLNTYTASTVGGTKVAYATLPNLDLTGYQQVSFWLRQSAGTLCGFPYGGSVIGMTSLRLCSDTIGEVPVHTMMFPTLAVLGYWAPLVYDFGADLGSGINSISIYTETPYWAASTFQLDNIIACKASSAADSLTLASLISKDPGDHSFGDGYECWHAIQSINGTRVVLDGTVLNVPSTTPQRGYSGATETVATYKRETTKTLMLAGADNSPAQQTTVNGTAGNLITYSGGWNRTDMSTQVGETWFDGQNGRGNGLYTYSSATNFLSFDKLNFTRYYYGLDCGGYGAYDTTIGRIECCNTTYGPINYGASARTVVDTVSAVNCGQPIYFGVGASIQTVGRADNCTGGVGINLGTSSNVGSVVQANNNLTTGIQAPTLGKIGSVLMAAGNGAYGVIIQTGCKVGYLAAVNNLSAGIAGSGFNYSVSGGYTLGNFSGVYSGTTGGTGNFRNFTFNEALEVSLTQIGSIMYSENHDGIPGNSRIFYDGGLVIQQTGVVHGAATSAWQVSPTNTARTQEYPLALPLAQIAVGAATLVTVKVWFQRSNTGLTGKLVCKGGQLPGVTSDVIATMTAGANTWEELSISFTPSTAGVVEIEAQFYGGSTYSGYVSDATFNQA